MKLSVKGHNVDVGESLRAHIEEKLESVKQKYFNRVTDATVIFGREAQHLFRVNTVFHVGHDVKVQATAESTAPYLAFDESADRVAKQLRRYKTRLRDHHDRLDSASVATFITAHDYTLESSEAEEEPAASEPVIVAEATTSIPVMSVSEAVMRMDLAEQDFMLFKNSKTETLNVVYRRPDGNIGWIDPSLPAAKTKAA